MAGRTSDDEVARYWDDNAPVWAEHVRGGWDRYREELNTPAFLRLLNPVGGDRVLDAGCGEGTNSRLLARRGARVTGVDISTRMIALAREHEAAEPLGIRYERASFSDLSLFADGSFDQAVSFMALMDGPDYPGAIRELFRVLRPGGFLTFSVTHPCFMTPGYGWLRDDQGERVRLTVGGYFSTDPRVERWRFSKAPANDAPDFAVPRFPRTLASYLNGLVLAGFMLTQVQEPRPSAEDAARAPWLRRWRDHAAPFLHLQAFKPA